MQRKNSNINSANEKYISVDARGYMKSVKIYEWENALSQMYKWQRFGERFKTLWKKFQQASTSRTNILSQIWCLGGCTVAHLAIWGDNISGDNVPTIPASAEKERRKEMKRILKFVAMMLLFLVSDESVTLNFLFVTSLNIYFPLVWVYHLVQRVVSTHLFYFLWYVIFCFITLFKTHFVFLHGHNTIFHSY